MSKFAMVDLIALDLPNGTHEIAVTANYDGEASKSSESTEYTAGAQPSLRGVWKFNVHPVYTDTAIMCEKVNFTAEGIPFYGVYADANGTAKKICYMTRSLASTTYDLVGTEWELKALGDRRTIDFGETPQRVSSEFYVWFTANATPQTRIITYNGNAIATLSPGQKATLNCAGKKMVGDITIATADETTDGSVFGEEVATTG